jgi:hypothetical protein
MAEEIRRIANASIALGKAETQTLAKRSHG